jgi:hypothetical protein
MVKNILYEIQQEVVALINADSELSSVAVLAENNKDIEYEI